MSAHTTLEDLRQAFLNSHPTEAAFSFYTTPLTVSITGVTPDTVLPDIPDPADTPGTADALRDDLVANVLPPIKDALVEVAVNLEQVRLILLKLIK